MTRVLLLAPLLLTACAAPAPAPQKRPPTPPVRVTPLPPSRPEPAAAQVRSETLIIGRSRRGRPITLRTFGEGPEVVLFLASIHGSEPAGTPLLERLARELEDKPAVLGERRALIIAVVNPDGLARGERRNARGLDLNRNFPAKNFRRRGPGGQRPLSEPESGALFEVIAKEKPARVVSIHQPFGCVDYDGPGESLARAMAKACRLPVKKLGGRPGSLGSYVGIELGRPIVTLELPAGAEKRGGEELWKRYGSALLLALRGELSPSSADR